jgi:hypothetical protein
LVAVRDSLKSGYFGDALRRVEQILTDHPHKTDGVFGVEIDEWPDYASYDKDGARKTLAETMLVLEKKGWIKRWKR